MALIAEHVPEDDRRGLVAVIVEADRLRPADERLMQLVLRRARFREAGEVALHIGQEDRRAGPGELLGENL